MLEVCPQMGALVLTPRSRLARKEAEGPRKESEAVSDMAKRLYDAYSEQATPLGWIPWEHLGDKERNGWEAVREIVVDLGEEVAFLLGLEDMETAVDEVEGECKKK